MMPAPKRSPSRWRRYVARFERHNGNTDEHNNPTYTNPKHWLKLPGSYPCEVIGGSAGERVRGRQVTEMATHVLIGDFANLAGVSPPDRATLNDGRTFEIVAVNDNNGTWRDMHIEVKFEK